MPTINGGHYQHTLWRVSAGTPDAYLKTRHLPEARKRRDVALGDIRKLENSLSDGEAFSLNAAVEWRDTILAEVEAATSRGDDFNVPSEFALSSELEKALARGVPEHQLKRFARVVAGRGFPVTLAHSKYVNARLDTPYGYEPLKQATVMGLETAVKRPARFT